MSQSLPMIATRRTLSRIVPGGSLALCLALASLSGCGGSGEEAVPVSAEQAATDSSLINVQRFESEDQER